MRGPCGARLSRARCGQTGRVIPATLTPREWPACRGMGAHANVAHAQDRRNGPCGPMRGPCGARLAMARCGPTGRVIPAARTPRMVPTCRCMAGVPAGIAALADAVVLLLKTTRVHVCSRSGHVNMGCVITHMSLSYIHPGSLRTHVTETRHAGAASSATSCIGPCGPMRGACGPRLTPARHRPTEGRGPATQTPRMGPHAAAWGAMMHPLVEFGAARPMCGPMRGPCGARLTRARCGPTGGGGPATRAPRRGPACHRMGGACHVAHAGG